MARVPDLKEPRVQRVVLATSNVGKLREMSALLAPLGLELLAQSSLGIRAAAETGTTFVENALIKAHHGAHLAQLPAIADDSGIEVDALDGRPGVTSARFAGENAGDVDNLRKLLTELHGVPAEFRQARYHCVIVFVRDAHDRNPVIAHGTWEGQIATEPRGSGGFGYDPIFIPAGLHSTAAQLPPEQKNKLSHRAQAFAALVTQLKEIGVPG
jgi:XTP/dITP diphosphohydrolase